MIASNVSFKNYWALSALACGALFIAYLGFRLVRWILCPQGTAKKTDDVSNNLFSTTYQDSALILKGNDSGLLVKLFATRLQLDPEPKRDERPEIESKEKDSQPPECRPSEPLTVSQPTIPYPPDQTFAHDAFLKQVCELFPELFEFMTSTFADLLAGGEKHVLAAFEHACKMQASHASSGLQAVEPAPLLQKNCHRGTHFMVSDGHKKSYFCSTQEKTQETLLQESVGAINSHTLKERNWELLIQCLCTDSLSFAAATAVANGKAKLIEKPNTEKLALVRRGNNDVFPLVRFTIVRTDGPESPIQKVLFEIDELIYDFVENSNGASRTFWKEAVTATLKGEATFVDNQPIVKIDRIQSFIKSSGPAGNFYCNGIAHKQNPSQPPREPGYDYCDSKD